MLVYLSLEEMSMLFSSFTEEKKKKKVGGRGVGWGEKQNKCKWRGSRANKL